MVLLLLGIHVLSQASGASSKQATYHDLSDGKGGGGGGFS